MKRYITPRAERIVLDEHDALMAGSNTVEISAGTDERHTGGAYETRSYDPWSWMDEEDL